MFRLSAVVTQRASGFAHTAAATAGGNSTFVQRAAHLKRRFRGKGQYAFARAEAQRFLDAEVPKVELSAWIEQDTNAVALVQMMNFFEVEVQDASLASLLLNKLVRTAEAGGPSASALTRLDAVLSLLLVRPEENYERACGTVDDVLRHLEDAPASNTQRWRLLDHCAKVLQRCGRRVTTDTNARLAQAVALQIQRTPLAELVSEQTSLLRIYAWMARADMTEADDVLAILRANVGHMRAFEYSTMMGSVWRHHQFRPLGMDTIKALARDGLQYCTSANGHDISVILGTVARLLSSVQRPPAAPQTGVEKSDAAAEEKPAGTTSGDEPYSAQAVGQLADRFAALLEDFQPRVLDLMDAAGHLYWKKSEDIVAIAYAYELGGRARHRAVFLAFQAYVTKEVATLEPAQLALTVGILHRSLLLSPDLMEALSARLETVLGELRLPELSHVCAALASTKPSWIGEAEAVAVRLVEQAEGPVPAATYLQLALAFPQVRAFTRAVNCAEMNVRQLMDSLLGVLQTPHEGPVTEALIARLANPVERFTPDDIHLLRTCQRAPLADAAARYLHQRFAEPAWTTDTLFCAPLATPNEPLARDVHKAMQAAASASVSPELFVSLVELLTGLFGSGEAEVATFVVKGGGDILAGHGVLLRTVVRYLCAVRRYPPVFPDVDWLRAFTEKLASVHKPVLRADELESLLISLHAIYRNCEKTPALQVVLSQLTEVYYDGASGKGLRCANSAHSESALAPGVDTARVTVLLAHLQQGMSLPVLTATTATVVAVRAHVNTYSPDVRQAVLSMPLPASASGATPGVQLGRFTLKRRPASADDASHDEVLDQDDAADDGAARADPAAPAPGSTVHNSNSNSGDRRHVGAAPFSVLDEDPFAMDAVPVSTKVTEPARKEEATPAAVAEPSMGTANSAPAESHADNNKSTAEHGESYYAKFFNKTVGQILNGHRRHGAPHEAEANTSPHAPPEAQEAPAPHSAVVPPAATHERRPHRTTLKPFSAATTPTAASPPVAPPVSTPEPVATPASSTPTTTEPMPSASPTTVTATPAAAVAVAAPESGVNAFERLFGAGSAAPPPPVQPPASAPVQAVEAPHSNPVAAAFAQLFSSGPAAEEPAPAPASAAPHSVAARPQGGHFFVDPSKPAEAGAIPNRPVMRVRPVMSRRPGMASDPATATAVTAAQSPEVSLDATTAQGGVGNFMNQAGLSKVTGYNMASSAPLAADVIPSSAAAAAVDTSYTQQQGFSPQGSRLAWQETARQLARVTRRPLKAKATRAQTSLSEWLSTPDATLQDADAAAVGADGKNATASKRGRKAKAGKGAAPAAANATAAAPAVAKTRGRKPKAQKPAPKKAAAAKGKRGSAAKTGKPAKSAKPAKPAKAPKAAAKSTKAAKKPAAAKKKAAPAKKPAAAARKAVKKAAASKPKKVATKAKAKGKKK